MASDNQFGSGAFQSMKLMKKDGSQNWEPEQNCADESKNFRKDG
jgi:hypothetical protein